MGSSTHPPAVVPGPAIVVVGADAAGLGVLARRLREEHGLRVGVFVGEPADEAVPSAVAEMAKELYAERERPD